MNGNPTTPPLTYPGSKANFNIIGISSYLDSRSKREERLSKSFETSTQGAAINKITINCNTRLKVCVGIEFSHPSNDVVNYFKKEFKNRFKIGLHEKEITADSFWAEDDDKIKALATILIENNDIPSPILHSYSNFIHDSGTNIPSSDTEQVFSPFVATKPDIADRLKQKNRCVQQSWEEQNCKRRRIHSLSDEELPLIDGLPFDELLEDLDNGWQ